MGALTIADKLMGALDLNYFAVRLPAEERGHLTLSD